MVEGEVGSEVCRVLMFSIFKRLVGEGFIFVSCVEQFDLYGEK